MKQKLTAVVPFYNEEKHVEKVVKNLRKYVDNIVLVNDGSKDNTLEIMKKLKNKSTFIVTYAKNKGKGFAVRKGCDYAVKELKTDLIVLLDGDDQHDPTEIKKFLELIHEVDIVFGRRPKSGQMPVFFRVGSWGLTMATFFLFGIHIADSQGGFRMLTADAYKKVRWESNDYSMETEMVIRTAINKLRFTEIPVKTIYHEKYKGTNVMDGVKNLLRQLKWRLTVRKTL